MYSLLPNFYRKYNKIIKNTNDPEPGGFDRPNSSEPGGFDRTNGSEIEYFNDLYAQGVYKKRFSLKIRKTKSYFIRKEYPNHIPIILEYGQGFPIQYRTLAKQKYLVPECLPVSNFLGVVRKNLSLPPTEALCLIVNNYMVKATNTVREVYDKNKDPEDSLLYITVMIESTFG